MRKRQMNEIRNGKEDADFTDNKMPQSEENIVGNETIRKKRK